MSLAVNKPTLTYFNVAARGEVTRLILEESGVDYDFVTVADWPSFKTSDVGVKLLPFRQLPVYQEPGGFRLAQSGAIVRYLGHKYHLAGTNEKETALIDMIYEGVSDLGGFVVDATYKASEDQKPAKLHTLTTEILPKWLSYFEDLLRENNGGQGFIVGNSLSYADLFLFHVLKWISQLPGGKDVVDSHELLKHHNERIGSRRKIKAYLETNPYKKD